jgi:hypothetical protein
MLYGFILLKYIPFELPSAYRKNVLFNMLNINYSYRMQSSYL